MQVYTITHRGVPIGTIDLLPSGDRVAVAVTPLAGYAAIRPLVRSASTALSAVALATPAPIPAPSASQAALARAAELGRTLELRDAAGALVPTDFIDLTDWPGGDPEVAAIVGLRDSHAPSPAQSRPGRLGDAGSAPPAG